MLKPKGHANIELNSMKIDKCAENINGTPYNKGDDMFRTLGKPKESSRNEMVALRSVVTDCVGIVIAIG